MAGLSEGAGCPVVKSVLVGGHDLDELIRGEVGLERAHRRDLRSPDRRSMCSGVCSKQREFESCREFAEVIHQF